MAFSHAKDDTFSLASDINAGVAERGIGGDELLFRRGGAQSVEDRSDLIGPAIQTPRTKMFAAGFGVRTEHSEFFQSRRKRERVVFVFEQNHGLRGKLDGKCDVVGMAQGGRSAGWVGAGMLEKTSPEFGEQDARDGVIQPGSGQFAGINQCPDIAFVKSSDHLHVNPSSESPQSCRPLITSDAVTNKVED